MPKRVLLRRVRIAAGWLGLISASLPLAGCRPEVNFYQVGSSSMAPKLMGPTHQAVCRHCAQAFAIAADSYRPGLPTRCGRCGGDCAVDEHLRPGATVRRLPVQSSRSLQRFDLVAFTARGSEIPQVKRIWGLPGERICLRDGELYIATIDGLPPRLCQKSFAQLRRLSVPVANFPADRFSHWWLVRSAKASGEQQPASVEEGFQTEETTPLVAAAENTAPDISSVEVVAVEEIANRLDRGLHVTAGQVLQWRYRRPAPVHTDSVTKDRWLVSSPILDDYEVNQGISCRLHVVDDYLLDVQLQSPLKGEIQMLWRVGQRTIPLSFHPPDIADGRSSSVAAAASQVGTGSSGHLQFAASSRLAVAWCDQRLLIETDAQSCQLDVGDLWPLSLDGLDQEHIRLDPAALIQIQSSSELRLSHLRVARDLHLGDWEGPVAETGGYFVLGDNLPVSVDSRGALGRIAIEAIVGRIEPE